MRKQLISVAMAAILSVGIVLAPINAQAQNVSAQTAAQDQAAVQAQIDAALPGIVCWGDSITKGARGNGVNYPLILQQLIDYNLIQPIRQKTGFTGLTAPQVVNMGVGGESSSDIAGRQGGLPLVITQSFIIPASGLSAEIHFASPYKLSSANILIQGDGGVNPVAINGVLGELVRKEDEKTEQSRYYFKRLQAGSNVTVPVGTQIVTSGSVLYAGYLQVIMMGQNGGWDNVQDLVTQYQQMINHATWDRSKYLAIGMIQGYDTDLKKIQMEDATFKKAFGKRYINAGKELNTRGLQLAGIAPTAEDQKRIKEGLIPASLLDEDMIHYNPQGYQTFGLIVYQKLDSLGYFDGLKALAR